MKFLLVLLVVMVGVWIWRSNRADERAERAQGQRRRNQAPGSEASIAMLRCDQCGVHVPQGEVIAGRRGVYCSAEHRQQAEN